MKTFFLPLILSLMITGCDASDKVKGCEKGWLEFTCEYPETNGNYNVLKLVSPRGKTTLRNRQKDVWINNGSVSLYHNTTNRKLRVVINELHREDFGDYKCKFVETQSEEKDKTELKVVAGGDWCQEPFNQTAYRTAKTTITCEYEASNLKSKVWFLCKENGTTCDDIYSTSSPAKSKSDGAFTGSETDGDISLSISNVSSQHAGVYWCGVESNKGHYRTAVRQIQLVVKDTITNFTRSPTIGQNLAYWCQFPDEEPEKKFICKGEDPSICQRLVSTSIQLKTENGRFSMKVNSGNRNITITIREVTTEDSGTYWCGAESSDPTTKSPSFFHRVLITVDTTKTTAAPESYAPERNGASVIIPVVACAVVLALVLILVLLYKRFKCSKNTGNGAAKNAKEDRFYEEIQERPQKADVGTALTVYATANFPTHPPALNQQPYVIFQNSSDKVDADTYSTVENAAQCPAYSTVNLPSTLTNDAFYSTLSHPQ